MLSAEQAQNLCRGSARNTKLAAKVIFIIFVAYFNGIGIILNMFRKSCNRRLLLALVIVTLVAQMLQGKDIVAQIEKDSGGQVTITAPKELENRKITGKAAAEQPKGKPNAAAQGKKEGEQTRAEHESDNVKELSHEQQQPEETLGHEHQHRVPTTTQQHISNRSVGYRIQAYSDNNFRTAKSSAKARAKAIAMKYPQYRSYLTYKAPFWRLKIGDFRSHGEAIKVLNQMRRSFPNFSGELTVVRDRINVWSYE